MTSPAPSSIDLAILARLEKLERQNRRMKRIGCGVIALAAFAFIGGWQDPNRRISADEITCGVIRAQSFHVSTDKGEVTLDKTGLVITGKGEPTSGRTNLVDHEARIEIGLDWDWSQQNALRPTPRVAVGRVGHDTSGNLMTRITLISPEGCHSGEWHTNNPDHDGRTDRDLIDSLRNR